MYDHCVINLQDDSKSSILSCHPSIPLLPHKMLAADYYSSTTDSPGECEEYTFPSQDSSPTYPLSNYSLDESPAAIRKQNPRISLQPSALNSETADTELDLPVDISSFPTDDTLMDQSERYTSLNDLYPTMSNQSFDGMSMDLLVQSVEANIHETRISHNIFSKENSGDVMALPVASNNAHENQVSYPENHSSRRVESAKKDDEMDLTVRRVSFSYPLSGEISSSRHIEHFREENFQPRQEREGGNEKRSSRHVEHVRDEVIQPPIIEGRIHQKRLSVVTIERSDSVKSEIPTRIGLEIYVVAMHSYEARSKKELSISKVCICFLLLG
jgi:hypothetical protein